jgi:hypothetical protein
VLVEGTAVPEPRTGGAGGASNDPRAGLDADGGESPSEPTSPCTALALCCSKFDTEDPAQAWCQQTLTQATSEEDCEGFVEYFGC